MIPKPLTIWKYVRATYLCEVNSDFSFAQDTTMVNKIIKNIEHDLRLKYINAI